MRDIIITTVIVVSYLINKYYYMICNIYYSIYPNTSHTTNRQPV